LYTRNFFTLTVILLFASVLYAKVFTANYLYLDEAYQLWNRDGDHNFLLFAKHGRLFSGIIFKKIYSGIDTVAQVKFLRVASLSGWIIASYAVYYFSKIWVRRLQLHPYLPFLLAVFCICSSSVAIYIGWSSSAEVFLAFLTGLFSGHFLFILLFNQGTHFDLPLLKSAIVLGTGVITLLIHQTAFGVFLLPFLMMWIAKGIPYRNKKIIIAIVFYLVTYLAYYLVFKYYLKKLDIIADTRTDLVFQPLKKIRFFFSTPFSQAWSLNFLHNLHSVLSQVFPLLVFGAWIFLFVRQSGGGKFKFIAIKLGGILLLLFLSYLPSIVAKENFSSYRTMIAMNLGVFILFGSAVLTALQSERNRKIFVLLFSLLLFVVAYINFNNRFVFPLQKEYQAIHDAPLLENIKPTDTIVFIRADSKLFKTRYGLTSYKDEFSIPSTYRDWVPEGLTRQVLEERRSPAIARSVTIYQFENVQAFEDSMKQRLKQPVVIDMNTLVK
jgi:hypothetical protein